MRRVQGSEFGSSPSSPSSPSPPDLPPTPVKASEMAVMDVNASVAKELSGRLFACGKSGDTIEVNPPKWVADGI
jgi:hypothetical protein